ncbi:MAG TPA: hypothetical protein VN859_07465 [Steroidobacteraceae bacterium]|nr:hypothetical protein [Steroidobacteraceae bacterium]
MQQFVIALAVAVSVAYLVWSFSSLSRRQRWLDALAGRGLLVQVAARHRARLGAPGCGNCSAAGTHQVRRP